MSKQGMVDQKSLLQQRAQKQQSFSPASILGNKSLPLKQGIENTGPAGAGAEQQKSLPIQSSPAEK
jgi:hypothetical protein